jgi:hypothetical protein
MTVMVKDGAIPKAIVMLGEESVFTKRAGPAGMACEKRRSAGRAAKEGAIRQAVVLTGDLRAQPASLGGRVIVETGEC